MMWDKLKQSLGLQKQGQARAKPGSKSTVAGKVAPTGQSKALIAAPGSSEKKTAPTLPGAAAAPPKDPKEVALDLERAAVRASFQSDPQTVVAVIRAWLHEDAKQAAATKEDAKPK
jgi:hypothetical protein